MRTINYSAIYEEFAKEFYDEEIPLLWVGVL